MKKIFTLVLLMFFGLSVAVFCVSPSAQEYFDRATLQYLSGSLDNALQSLSSCLKIQPNFPGAKKLKASIMREKGLYPPIQAQKEAPKKKEVLPKPEAEDTAGETGEDNTLNYISFVVSFLVLVISLGSLVVFSEEGILAKMKNRRPKGFSCQKCGGHLLPDVEFCPKCGNQVGLKMWNTISQEQHLWYKKMGWGRNPFSLDSRPELFTGHKHEVKEILDKVSARSGHVLITGPLGMGKTTLLRWLSIYLPRELKAIYIPRPPQDFNQLIRLIVENLGFTGKDVPEYDIYNLEKLQKKVGKGLVLLLDEAHEFNIEIERPLRTLGDLDEVRLVLGGLPETIDKLKNEIRPLYERIVLSVELKKLGLEDFKKFIQARIEDAGGKGTHPLTEAALEKVYEISKGNPRVSLKICDAALTQAINLGEDKITPELIIASFPAEPA